MGELWRDMRFGIRILRRSPVFATAVVLLLAAGIGANTLIFAVVDQLLLRPLPIPDPQRLVRMVEVHPTGFVTWDLPYLLYRNLRAHSSTLTNLICQGDLDVAFTHGAGVERIRINAVSPDFFRALRIPARIGRVLSPEDAYAAVISDDFWRSRLGGSASAVGSVIRLNGKAFTVVGVLPPGINGVTVDTAPSLRVPITTGYQLAAARTADSSDVDQFPVQVFGWIRPEVRFERANVELEPLLRASYDEAELRAYPEMRNSPMLHASRLELEPAGQGISALRGPFSRGLAILMSGVALLLVMACANVACLLLARSAARSGEMEIRRLLGAAPSRILRQLLTESAVLAAAGGALGIAVTYAARPLMTAALPPVRDRAAVLQPLAVHLDVDWRVLAFAVLVTMTTAILFGIAPALRSASHSTRSVTRRLSGQNLLVMIQVALCTVLLAGAIELVRTLESMRRMDPGFDRDHVVTFTVDPGLKGYTPERARVLSRRLLATSSSLPGVTGAGLASRAVMRGTGIKSTFAAAGSRILKSDFLNTSLNSVTPGYFNAMGMRITAGRDFNWFDRAQKPRPAVVNEAFVRRFFRQGHPVGRLFGTPGQDGLATPESVIVGVVNDARYRSLREPVPPTVYGAAPDGFESGFAMHLRTPRDPAALIAPVRDALRSLDPELPFIEIHTLREEVNASLWQERLLAWLSAAFACFAALLAGIGLYGALDFAIRARTREIGVRAALGAGPGRIARLLSSGLIFTIGIGAATGLAVHAVAARWFRQLLYESGDVQTAGQLVALGVLLAVSLISAARPIWRAVRMDPAAALRHD